MRVIPQWGVITVGLTSCSEIHMLHSSYNSGHMGTVSSDRLMPFKENVKKWNKKCTLNAIHSVEMSPWPSAESAPPIVNVDEEPLRNISLDKRKSQRTQTCHLATVWSVQHMNCRFLCSFSDYCLSSSVHQFLNPSSSVLLLCYHVHSVGLFIYWQTLSVSMLLLLFDIINN